MAQPDASYYIPSVHVDVIMLKSDKEAGNGAICCGETSADNHGPGYYRVVCILTTLSPYLSGRHHLQKEVRFLDR